MRSNDILAMLDTAYGLKAAITRLDGENDNYLVTTDSGARFVLKIAAAGQAPDLIELENAAVSAVQDACPELTLPQIVRTRSGELAATLPPNSAAPPQRARLLRYVDGEDWFDGGRVSHQRAFDFGRQAARITLALGALDHPAMQRSHQWDLARAGIHRHRTASIDDPNQRRLVRDAFLLWCGAEPLLADLPHSLIHGDLNDENLRVKNDRLYGVIDFGDCLYNPVICELAIALVYLTLDQPEPLALAAQIVAGYHRVRPLAAAELEVLFPLMCGRLATSVVIAAGRRRIDPDRTAWFVTEARAWRALEQYAMIDPVEAAEQLAANIDVPVFVDRGSPPAVLLQRRQARISSSLSLTYREPLKVMRGRGQYLFDERGHPHLDMYNNVCHVGHCHPHVVAAAQQQMSRLNTNSRYLFDQMYDYADRLCATLPPPLQYCFFVNSGSEANELALRLAFAHTGAGDLFVVDNAYHGHTNLLTEISPYKFMGPGGIGKPAPWVHVVPMPDGYRGMHKGQGRDAGMAYGEEVGRRIAALGRPLAGFIAESLLSCGGQIIPPAGYFETVFAHVRRAGGVCILDEVQVGFGRVGSHFWGFELQGVVPDIVVMGKPIGNGHPLGAVVTTREIAASFAATGMEFFSTFGGNPVSCAIGMAVLDVIRDEQLQAHALDAGTYLRDGLHELMAQHQIIGDVRGTGLFIGIELVRDRTTRQPATAAAKSLVNALRRRRILTGTDGPFDNVIKIKPPLVVSHDDATMMIETVDEILRSSANPDDRR